MSSLLQYLFPAYSCPYVFQGTPARLFESIVEPSARVFQGFLRFFYGAKHPITRAICSRTVSCAQCLRPVYAFDSTQTKRINEISLLEGKPEKKNSPAQLGEFLCMYRTPKVLCSNGVFCCAAASRPKLLSSGAAQLQGSTRVKTALFAGFPAHTSSASKRLSYR